MIRRFQGYRIGSVYFVRCQNYLKIGWSDDVEKRVETLQTASPFSLFLVATIPNKTKLFERTLHKQFAHLHWRGDWFRFDDQLQDFVFRVANNCDYIPQLKGIVA